MNTIDKRNDILYGQNWVEQMREVRRLIHYVPMCISGYPSPYAVVNRMINDPTHSLPHHHTWERRRDMFGILYDMGHDYILIK